VPPESESERATIDIRQATDADHDAVIELAAAALGWRAEDPNAELFRWKHLANPFGPSPMWVAVDGDRLAAFRTLLRWEFDEAGHPRQRAARAVDTATHPDYQGRGLFTRLTRHAIDALHAEGADFIFNTPNAQSRPGYLKMGWVDVGRVPVAVAVRSPGSAARLLRARVAAEKWSLPTDAGLDAAAVFADAAALESLLEAQPPASGLRTHRSVAFFQWRYASGPLRYRVMLRTARLEDGFAVFRLRQRGAAVEATVCDVVVPEDDPRLVRTLLRLVMRAARPDYAIQVQHTPVATSSFIRLPGQGPRLTWRALHRPEQPPLASWDLCLGDIELF